MKKGSQNESVNNKAANEAVTSKNAAQFDPAQASGAYVYTLVGPIECLRWLYVRMRDFAVKLDAGKRYKIADFVRWLMRPMEQVKWVEEIHNLVTTVGKNDALDKYFAGSAYTAAWYLMLISATGYTTGPAAGDTMASHGGWAEDQNYSEGTRPAPSWNAASGGSKATTATSFSINATTTIKGSGMTTDNTKGGTTGILYSAGLFSGGDKAVSNGDTLNATWIGSL